MKKDPRSWFLLALLALIWGASFILMKRGMQTTSGEAIFSDTQVAALRMGIAGLVMLPFGILAARKVKTRKQILSLIVVGFSGNFFPAFLFTFAETKLSSGLAGMLNSFTPFFTLVIGWLLFRQQLKLLQVTGLSIAFAGICLLVYTGGNVSSSGSWLHSGAIVLATVLYGLSLNTIRHTLSDFKSWEITSIAFSFVSVPAVAALFFTGTFQTISTNPFAWEGLGYITILSLLGTCAALLIFNTIIARTSAVFASSVTYLIPFVAVFFGTVLNNESFHVIQLLAIFIVLTGVFVSGRQK